MAGAIAIVIVLLLFPILVAIGGMVIAALLGESTWRDVQSEHEGSELVDLNT